MPCSTVASYKLLGKLLATWPSLCPPHELQQLEDDVVVAQEPSPLVGGDVRVGLQDAIEHSDHFVFGFAFDIRWHPVIARVT